MNCQHCNATDTTTTGKLTRCAGCHALLAIDGHEVITPAEAKAQILAAFRQFAPVLRRVMLRGVAA